MLTYLYFVKCQGCEDEHFDFFNDAKDFALGCLSKKPIITQIEVDRNDFGECTDSCDLGTIWSWEEMMETDATPAKSIFTKDDLKRMANGQDPEFDNIDNSLDFDSVKDAINFLVKDEEDAIAGYEKVEDAVEDFDIENKKEILDTIYHIKKEEEEHIKELETMLNEAYVENPRELMRNKREDDAEFDEETGERVLIDYDENGTPVNKLDRKPVPEGMTIEQLVEAMEENEDEVECRACEELHNKSACHYDEEHGWVCEACSKQLMTEAFNPNDKVEFIYDSLFVTLQGPKRAADDWDEAEESVRHSFYKTKEDVATDVWENFIEEADAKDVEGGLETLEDDKAWNDFLVKHFDELLDKYYDKLLKYYEDDARKEYEETHSLNESAAADNLVELEYPSLTVTLYGKQRDVDDWDELEHTTSHVFLVSKVEVATAIWENWITEEDVKDVEGGLETLEDDTAWEKFLETHFDDLFEKYEKQILEYFKEEAAEDFRERSQEEHDLERWTAKQKQSYADLEDVFNESNQKPFLEEFDDAETHKARLTDCPECGSVSYDMKEQYCTNCGLNL